MLYTWASLEEAQGKESAEGKESACSAGDPGSVPGSERSLEKETATHSSMLAWKMLWTEEPGMGSQSMGSQSSDVA